MSALPNSNPAPGPSNKDIVLRFREHYSAALADAAVSAEHTATEGWQKLYSGHKRASKDHRREWAKRLKNAATRLEDFGWSEDDEKGVKDLVKEAAELRENEEGWQVQVVDPVTAPVSACERICIEHINEAARIEADSPLHSIGLVETMRLEVAKQPKPVWNADAGTVTLIEPRA